MPNIELLSDEGWSAVAHRYASVSGKRLWIAANHRASMETQRRLSTVRPGMWRPAVRTLRQAATALVADTLPPVRRLTPAQQSALVDQVVSRGLSSGRIERLEGLTRGKALSKLALRIVRELRREGVAPRFAKSRLESTEGDASDALAWLYRAYCDAVKDSRLIDEAELLTLAAETVRSSANGHGFELLVLQPPLKPGTATEIDLLRALVAGSEAVIALAPSTLVEGSSESAGAWRTALAETLGAKATSTEAPMSASANRNEDLPAALAAIRSHLFDDDFTPLGAGSTAGVEVLAASGEQDEVRRVVTRLKRWLTADRTAVSDIVIAAPSVSYSERLRGELGATGIAASFDAAPPPSRSSWLRTVEALLRADASDWGYEELLSLVGRTDCGVFSRRTDGERIADVVERFVRQTQAPSGRRYLLERASRTDDRAIDGLQRVADSIDRLPDEAEPLEWFDALTAATEMLGWRAAEDRDESQRFEHATREAIERALAETETLCAWRGMKTPRWTRADISTWLSSATDWLVAASSRTVDPAVRVVGYDTAATLTMRKLVVVGLGETAFSLRNAAGADLSAAADLATLRFHALVARPTESLLLSYPALDGKAQAMRPSPLVGDIERLFEPGLLRKDPQQLQAVDREYAPATPRSLRLKAVVAAAEGDGSTLAAALGASEQAAGALLNAVRTTRLRARGDQLGPFEGATHPAAALLSDTFGADHPWSASQLERYATCPFQFFAHDVVHAEPLDDLRLAIDQRRRGSRVHQLLADLHATIETGPATSAEVAAALDRAFVAVSKEGALPEHQRALAAIERLQLERWLATYPEQTEEYAKAWSGLDSPLTPALFEARFGKQRRDADEVDKRSIEEPLRLDLPDVGPIAVEGTIDRVDVGEHAGKPVFSVIDYKTSKTLRAKQEDAYSGASLQPLLYAMAVRQLFLSEEDRDEALPLFAGYWGVRNRKREEPVPELTRWTEDTAETSENWTEAESRIRERVAQIVRGAREGDFSVAPISEDACKFCDYRRVCRVTQARAVGKLPETDAEEQP